jgi:hypothetical protein
MAALDEDRVVLTEVNDLVAQVAHPVVVPHRLAQLWPAATASSGLHTSPA